MNPSTMPLLLRARSVVRSGVLLACSSSLCIGQSPAGRALSESQMQAVAARLVASQSTIAQVWPDFWRPPAFAMYLRDSVALLYSESGAPTEFVAVESEAMARELIGRWYRRSGGIPGLRGGILPVDPRARPLALAVEAGGGWAEPFVEVMIHESFHGFQIRHFEPEPDSVLARLSDADSLSALAYEDLVNERQLGLRVLRTTEPHARRAAADAYLAARASRHTTGTARMVERRHERWEGIATFVGLSGLLAVEGIARTAFADSLAIRMSTDWRWGIGAQSATSGTRTRAYQSGALLAFLLDELECGEWKDRVQRGAYLDHLLAQCLSKRN